MKTDLALLILRLYSGGLMLVVHGWGKLNKVIDGNWKFSDPLGFGPELSLILATFAEFVCALFLVIGLYTRTVAIPLIITMATAAFIIHADDPFKKMEFAMLYLFSYIVIYFAGPGKFSLDQRFAIRQPL